MKSLIGSFIGLMLSVSGGADPLLEGQVRQSSGQPAVGVQVRLFDLTDLRRFIGTTTDETGHFALPLRAFSTDRGTALPTNFALGQNYPNPFNPSTIIPYQIPTSVYVRLEVFNMLGQHLATLVDGERSAGVHTAQWDGTDASGRAVGAGVYIYRLSGGGLMVSQRMVLIDGQAGVPRAGAAPEPVPSAVESSMEAESPVYGLTVTGESLVAYVDPAFRVGVDGVSIVVERHDGIPRMKRAASGILGDVNNDGQVDGFDVLYVLLYSGDPSIVLPNNGDISLGDVNGDGRVNLADAVLLVKYSSDPSDPTLPVGIGAPAGPAPALSHIYWTDWVTHKIQRANSDGSNIQDLVTGLNNPDGIALDVDEGKIYWADLNAHKIQRANLDGSNIETLIAHGTHGITPNGIALDADGDKIYWADPVNDKIQRANLDGSNIETLVTRVATPDGIALDVDGGKIYWVDASAQKIQRANLDGSNIETLVAELDGPGGIALDMAGGQMYWMDADTGSIYRANLDGSNIETLITGLTNPSAIALDVDGGKMYWVDVSNWWMDGSNWWMDGRASKIQRADLDGSNIETLITGMHIRKSYGIVLGP